MRPGGRVGEADEPAVFAARDRSLEDMALRTPRGEARARVLARRDARVNTRMLRAVMGQLAR